MCQTLTGIVLATHHFVKVGVTLFLNVGYVILEPNSSIVNGTLVGLMQGSIQMH